MKTFNQLDSLARVFESLMETANKPSLRQVYVSLLLMLTFAAFVQVHNIRQMSASTEWNEAQLVETAAVQEVSKKSRTESVLEQFAGVLAIPSLVLKTVNQFNGK
jgi:hypothetical protein